MISPHFARLTQVINKNNSWTNNHVDTPTLPPYNFTTNGHQLAKPVPIESPEKDLSIGTGLVSWWSVLRKLTSVKVVTQNTTNRLPPLFLCKCANPGIWECLRPIFNLLKNHVSYALPYFIIIAVFFANKTVGKPYMYYELGSLWYQMWNLFGS